MPTFRSGPIVRAVVAVGLLALLWLVVAVTVNGVFATRAPATALRWAPWSSVARIAMANALIGEGRAASPAELARARALARGALDRSPVQAAAARVIGLGDLIAGQEKSAGTAFAYAERLSRRDLPTELYWIETSVGRGDIRAALRHYDVAMRVSVKSRETLGNILIAAAATPQVANELARLLATRPRWLPEFYLRLMGQGQNPASLLHIAGVMAFDARDPSQAPFVSMALDRLVALGAYDEARTLYRRSLHGPDEVIRNAGFERPNRLQPFDWAIAGEPTYSGIVETRTGWPHGNVLTVTGTEANEVARQLLLLTPGRYRLEADTANVRRERETRPVLTLACVAPLKPFASIPFAAAGATPARMAGTFTVPAGCPAQWIAIRNTPSFDPVDSDPWIDRIAVRRVGS